MASAEPDRSALRPLELEELISGARAGGNDGSVVYEESGLIGRAAELSFFAGLFRLAQDGSPAAVAALAPAALALGWRLTLGTDQGRPVVVVTEDLARRRGAGAYVIRLGPVACETFVQTPHTWADLGTLALGRELFRAADARAWAVNTVHRRGRSGLVDGSEEEAPDPGGADVTKRMEATFQTVTLAWLAAGHAASLVQVHGFADGRVPADVVISAGAPDAAPRWAEVAQTTAAGLYPEARVALFPRDVDHLGATLNVQGQAARAAGARFVHIELAASLRQRVRSEHARGVFIQGLVTVLEAATKPDDAKSPRHP